MHIIPVIDLLNGVVVHAKQGQRNQYQPVQSLLTTSARPLDIVKAFRDIYLFETFYIADLNAIQRSPDAEVNQRMIGSLINQYPELTFWIDAGIRNTDELAAWHDMDIKPVIGTENLQSMEDYFSVLQASNQDCVLSLDFMPHGYQGPESLVTHSELWPQRVIAMTLNQVGAQLGPDWSVLQTMTSSAKHTHIYAAGGIRHLQDLQKLNAMHIEGALIASALHQLHLTVEDIQAIADTKKPDGIGF